jgi:hypothetical protein
MKRLLTDGIKCRSRKHELALSELMTILIFFHLSGFKCLKKFYFFLRKYHKKEFPKLGSYNRFVELQQSACVPLFIFFKCLSGQCDGESFIDATALPVCHIKREHSHKTFAGIAKKSKSTMGWFFGFKLHVVTTKYGHLIDFALTKGNVDDRKVPKSIFSKIFGKLFGDMGYISKTLFSDLKNHMIHIITAIKKNMKPQIMTMEDNEKLKKRGIVETTFNVLKNNLNLQHTRHRSPTNFVVNILGAMCAYCLRFFNDFSMSHKYLEAIS